MNERKMRAFPAAIIAAAGCVAGCSNPFAPRAEDYGRAIPRDRIRAVDTLDLVERPATPAETLEEGGEGKIRRSPPNRFEGLDAAQLPLEDVRAMTLANNLDLRVALIDPTIANERVTQEEAAFEAVAFGSLRTSEFETPTTTTTAASNSENISVEAGVRVPLRTGGDITVRLPFSRTDRDLPGFSTLNPASEADFELSITQPLLRNAGRWANTHRIRVAALNEGISESRTKLEVIRQVAAADRAYWRVYAARKALEVTQQQFELALDQLEQAERRVRAGDVANIEVVRAEEGLAQRLEAIIVAENEVLLRQRELKRLINQEGLEIESQIMLLPSTDPDPRPYELESASLLSQAVANRMEMLELELQLAIDESTIAFERNQALPLFTVDYTYRFNGLGSNTGAAFDVLRRGEFNDWSVGLQGEIPIGNERAKARVAEAILLRLQRLSTREARQLAIEQEVLDAIDQINSGWQRILAARQTTILAARTLRGEQSQFRAGAGTSNDVLEAATRLAESQLDEIRAVTEYQVAQVDLSVATGTLLGASRVEWGPLDPREEAVPLGERPDELPAPAPTPERQDEIDVAEMGG